ncbi:hypothetical protein AAFF_G00192240 [Aldrovandia affinis]|uniref:non-specific serine/threonine protein kinase n=1 Tax=Aldrovandia affinis TaxID=143900 RepID=A0AAD7RJ84_9TELE|nr:hypothetical protein AAFF_G00192240 [Aldrovandia affinis]
MKRKSSSGYWNRTSRGQKRRNNEGKEEEASSLVLEGPSSRRRKKHLSHKNTFSTRSLSCSQNLEGSSTKTDVTRSFPTHCNDPTFQRRVFEEKHDEGRPIGSGSYGRVYSGFRKEDSLPVAVKHIPLHKVAWDTTSVDGRQQEAPLEVVLHLIMSRESPTPKGVIRLLDWYKLQEEVVLVLERPVPSVDLFDFVLQRGGFLQEVEAKVILRQLVEAVLEIHGRGVVHRDIKLDNVLVQTDASGPLVHVLDFGCGGMLSGSPHNFHAGACLHMPPECYLRSEFHAVPSTVWQLGIVLYQMLTRIMPFSTPKDIIYQELYLWQELSSECQDLLRRCLDKRLRGRPTLEEILQHAWFQ